MPGKSGRQLTEEYMVRLNLEDSKELQDLAKDLKLPPTTVARMLVQFGLNRQKEFKARLEL